MVMRPIEGTGTHGWSVPSIEEGECLRRLTW